MAASEQSEKTQESHNVGYKIYSTGVYLHLGGLPQAEQTSGSSRVFNFQGWPL